MDAPTGDQKNTQRKFSQRLYLFSDNDVKRLEKLAEQQPELSQLLTDRKAASVVMARIAKIVGWATVVVTAVGLSEPIKSILSKLAGGV